MTSFSIQNKDISWEVTKSILGMAIRKHFSLSFSFHFHLSMISMQSNEKRQCPERGLCDFFFSFGLVLENEDCFCKNKVTNVGVYLLNKSKR